MSRVSRFRFASMTMDLSAIAMALASVAILTGADPFVAAGQITICLVVWLLVSVRVGAYAVSPGSDLRHSIRSAMEAWAVTGSISGLIYMQWFQHHNVWTDIGAGAAALILPRLLLRQVPGLSLDPRPRALIIGGGSPACIPSEGRFAKDFQIAGRVDLPDEPAGDLAPLCRFQDLQHHLQGVELVLLCPSDHARLGDIHQVFDLCDQSRLNVHYFPPFLSLHNLQLTGPGADKRDGIGFQTQPRPTLSMLGKRALDLVGASLGLMILLPVFVVVATLVKLSSRGPVFFRQTRVGENGEHFTCFKFRTMRVGAFALQEKLRAASVQDGPAFKIPNDPRITPVGAFLRKYSLDELPQLINVLLGDMSLVGPRPPIPSEVEHYTWWQRRRVTVKPGLTCVWQVWGRNRVSFKRWVEMDLFYIDNWSLWMDLKLIAHTFLAVMKGTGM